MFCNLIEFMCLQRVVYGIVFGPNVFILSCLVALLYTACMCCDIKLSKLTITWWPACLWIWLFVSASTILSRCDPEWGGEYCDEPVVPLPSQLKDSFSRAPSLSHWHILTGGKLSTVCGAVASGAALHFSGVNIHLHLHSTLFFTFYYIFFIMKCSPTRDFVEDKYN